MCVNYYMVRGMNSSESVFNELLSNEVVAVGWSDMDFTLYKDNQEAFDKELDRLYLNNPDLSTQTKGKWRTQSFRFCSIKKGDRIVVPYNTYVIFAEAQGEQLYKPEVRDLDLCNQQKVRFLRNEAGKIVQILRSDLPENMQRRLRVMGSTVLDFSEFEDIIDSVFTKKAYTYEKIYEKEKIEKIDKLKENLLNNIRVGETNLKAGGRGLEELVEELLKIDGYSTKILSKRICSGIGDVDIKAEKIDHLLGEQKLFIQVKHHQGVTNDWGIKQLEEAKKQIQNNNDDYKYIFLTTAAISEQIMNEAAQNDIICIDGQGFVDWLYDNLDRLSYETKRTLNIVDVPQIIAK